MIPFGENKISKNRIINRRMFILGAAKIIFLTGIVGRLFSLQISESLQVSNFKMFANFVKFAKSSGNNNGIHFTS